MKKRLAAALLCLVFIALCGCKSKLDPLTESSEPVSAPAEPVNKNAVNPFTGIQDLDPSLLSRRPVAVMVNNMSIAQQVQTGVGKADIVYETEVEGGITRLMAVFKDINKVGQIGPIRSARYPYVDLALGHDAMYIHCGQDPTYCAPHLKDIDDISVETNVYAKRISNGLAKEHTLYSFGETLYNGCNEKFSRTTTDKTKTWQTFAAEDEEVVFAGETQIANTITVPFNYSAGFDYDANTKMYVRRTGGSTRTDYVTGETLQFKNIFVLNTSIVNYPDGYHRQVYLDGGTGYYAVNGTYTPIRWSKGASTNEIKFTDEAGNPLKINTGTSWVYLVNESTTHATFQ